jgi:tetratricopeptide (TPR) repeat protein
MSEPAKASSGGIVRMVISIGIGIFIIAQAWAIAASDNFDLVLEKAGAEYRRAEFQESLKLYKKAYGMKEDCFECLWSIAQIYSRIGDHKNLLKTSQQLIKISAKDTTQLAKAWNLRGNALYSAAMIIPDLPDIQKFREAEAAFRETLKINPEMNIAHYSLGVTLLRQSRTNDAIEELKIYLQNPQEKDLAEKALLMIGAPIPKPLIEAKLVASEETEYGPKKSFAPKITNWESIPAELFSPAKGLAACRLQESASTRLEVTVLLNGQQTAIPYCGFTKSEELRDIDALIDIYPLEYRTNKVQIRFKDRLTGMETISDPVILQ